MGNAPSTSTLHPPDIIHMIGAPRPSPFLSLFLRIIMNTNRRTKKNKKTKKNREGFGTRLRLPLLVVCLYACTSNLTTSNLMATAVNLSGLTNCSPIFASVIIIGVVLVTFGVLFVAGAVGIQCCLKHINKGAEQYAIFYVSLCSLMPRPMPPPNEEKWSKRSATYSSLG